MSTLRRLLAITLLAIFGLPLFAPLAASAAPGKAGLPACCRRNGRHHCAMNLRTDGALAHHAPGLRAPAERCPYYPTQTTTTPSNFLAMTPAHAIFAELVSHPANHAQTQSRWRIARDRARQKRGPPSPIHS
jgi:hypothetical protein